MGLCMCAYVFGGQMLMLGIFFSCSPLWFLIYRWSITEPKAHRQARLATQQAWISSCPYLDPSELGLRRHTVSSGFYTVAGELKSGPNALWPSLYQLKHLPSPGFLALKTSIKRYVISFPCHSALYVMSRVYSQRSPFLMLQGQDESQLLPNSVRLTQLLLTGAHKGCRWHNGQAKWLPATHLYQSSQKSIGLL